jgi:hypothetical protein
MYLTAILLLSFLLQLDLPIDILPIIFVTNILCEFGLLMYQTHLTSITIDGEDQSDIIAGIPCIIFFIVLLAATQYSARPSFLKSSQF